MDILSLLGLAGLALIDSTSIGTLVLPIVLLLLPGFRTRRFLLYLATISSLYFAIGLALLFGATQLVRQFDSALGTPAVHWGQLIIGVTLFALSWFIHPGRRNKERAEQGLPPEPSRWEERLAGSTGVVAVMVVALLAGTAEVATMLPYLAAVGILTAANLSWASTVAILAGYVVVMCLPALILLGIRLALGDRASRRLQKVRDWVTRQAAASLPWVIGIIGFLLARDAAWRLGLLDQLIGG